MKEAIELIKKGDVVAFCGAGMSADSLIPTFRGKGGLWEKYNPNAYATIQGITSLFLFQPAKLKSFLIDCYQLILDAKPNKAHFSLAELEKKGYLIGVITQNIDDLDYQAGSKEVAEVHGNVYSLRCPKCGWYEKKEKDEFKEFISKLKSANGRRKIQRIILEFLGKCPYCKVRMGSGVVLFGQSLPETEIEKSYSFLRKAHTVLCIGTSGVVYPAASFPIYAKEHGATIVTINPEDTSLDNVSDVIVREKASNFFEKLSLQL